MVVGHLSTELSSTLTVDGTWWLGTSPLNCHPRWLWAVHGGWAPLHWIVIHVGCGRYMVVGHLSTELSSTLAVGGTWWLGTSPLNCHPRWLWTVHGGWAPLHWIVIHVSCGYSLAVTRSSVVVASLYGYEEPNCVASLCEELQTNPTGKHSDTCSK